MNINYIEQISLKEFINKVKKLSERFNVWIEGRGDGTINIIIEEKEVTLI